MTINWNALLLVALVTLGGAIGIVSLFSLGVGALTSQVRSRGGAAASAITAVGYLFLAAAGAIAVWGVHMIIPATK
jgi:TRAP-type C4-dicarboxylate transport system permease small subunit